MINQIEINIPAGPCEPLPVEGKPVLVLNGQPIDEVKSIHIEADGCKNTVVTIELFAHVTGNVSTLDYATSVPLTTLNHCRLGDNEYRVRIAGGIPVDFHFDPNSYSHKEIKP